MYFRNILKEGRKNKREGRRKETKGWEERDEKRKEWIY